MTMSRKRQKQLKRLRSSAEDLWHAQQEILDRANAIAREAGRQVTHLTREEVSPRLRETYDSRIRPGVDRGMSAGRSAVKDVTHRVSSDVLPAVGTAIGTLLSVADVAKDARVKAAVNRLSKKVPVKKSGPGTGSFIALGAGMVVLTGVGYALWQMFRADDELWVADGEPEVLPEETPLTDQ